MTPTTECSDENRTNWFDQREYRQKHGGRTASYRNFGRKPKYKDQRTSHKELCRRLDRQHLAEKLEAGFCDEVWEEYLEVRPLEPFEEWPAYEEWPEGASAADDEDEFKEDPVGLLLKDYNEYDYLFWWLDLSSEEWPRWHQELGCSLAMHDFFY